MGLEPSDAEPDFSGQGLPNSLVKARFDSSSGQMINSTRVLADGTWSMQISASQLGSKDTREIVFELDGQIFSDGSGSDALFKLSSATESDGGGLLLYIIIAVVVVAVLIAVGAFFFTFEEYDEEEEYAAQEQGDPHVGESKTGSIGSASSTTGHSAAGSYSNTTGSSANVSASRMAMGCSI